MNLQKYIDEKYISVQKHPTEDLFIYNYTQKAQFDRVWTDETLNCRGLIMDGKENIIARPFKKFFNYEEYIGEDSKLPSLPIEDFEVFEKYDGSLGILYWADNIPRIATKGSFTSDQAIQANLFLLGYSPSLFHRKYTYLFEILYPENRIVVDYQGKKGLILLAIFDTDSGKEFEYDQIYREYSNNFEIAKRYDGIKDITKLKKLEENNKEGFVIRFKSGLRVKIKFDEYVRLHRLITGINARHIWENLKEGKGIEELIEKVPDEFYKWVKETATRLHSEYEQIEILCSHIAQLAESLTTRKEQAEFILRNKNTGVIFKMLDKKDYSESIWKLIKPAHEVPFKQEI